MQRQINREIAPDLCPPKRSAEAIFAHYAATGKHSATFTPRLVLMAVISSPNNLILTN